MSHRDDTRNRLHDVPARGTTMMDSDKHFWHRYTSTYDAALSGITLENILEFGVFKGASIRWMRQSYPDARLVGVDILPVQPEWPQDDHIEYRCVDQGDDQAIAKMFTSLGRCYDLILEDGSHLPRHQARCLALSLPYVRPGGLYILEDIHTSHPHHPYSASDQPGTANALSGLLALQHLRETQQELTPELAKRLATPEFFTAEELLCIDPLTESFQLYRRSQLPLHCYACGSSDFDYAHYRCRCGVDLFLAPDSMSFLLRRRK